MLSRKGMALLLVVGLIVVVLAPAASAAKPITQRGAYSVQDFYIGTCDDGSAILENSEITFTDRLYFDNDGNLLKVRSHLAVEGFVSKSDTGNSLPVVGHTNATIYPESGTLISVGLVARVNVPGSGHVLLDAGRFVLDLATGPPPVWEAGTHQHVNGEVDEVCAALS